MIFTKKQNWAEFSFLFNGLSTFIGYLMNSGGTTLPIAELGDENSTPFPRVFVRKCK